MASTLIFPDGVRLSTKDEIPGAEPQRSEHWTRIQAARIAPGFVLKLSDDERFTHYAEINVDAPHIWTVFRDLCQDLLKPVASLLFGEIDAEPVRVGSGQVSQIIATLEPYRYQLAHDGYLQFGLVSDSDGALDEVFVTPTKHFQVWLNDEDRFRAIVKRYDLHETDALEFLDQYPRTTIALSASGALPDIGEFAIRLKRELAAVPASGYKH